MADAPQPVFLSYANEDADAARRICEALRGAGLLVWFDRDELRGGDAWDAKIRRQIHECALFVPLISANTEARSEGYFRLEWRLAVERSHQMADDRAFLLPVAIDDIAEASARVPDRFRERHWTRLGDGKVAPEFVDLVRRILQGTAPRGPAPHASHAASAPDASSRRRGPLLAAVLAGVVVLTAAGLWYLRRPATPSPARGTATVAQGPSRKSIAVLPFENLTGRAEDAYLADGLQEEILNALARMRDLNVISRTSVGEFRGSAHNVRDISRRLGVGTVLEGSVRRDGNTLRLTIQLIDARDDRHLLAANYDRDLGHVLGLQREVARQVADALTATLSSYERGELQRVGTNDGDAYNRYLRAVALFRRPVPNDENGLVEPRRLLEEAVRLDPDYADALALLSQAYTWGMLVDSRLAHGPQARQAYERALASDPQLPEAQLARGLYEMYVSKDLDRALADLEAVVRVRPNSAAAHDALGYVLRRRRRFEEALTHFARASDLDPLNHAYDGGAVITLLGLRRFPEALDKITLYISRYPDDPDGYIGRASLQCSLQHSLEPLRAVVRDHAALFDTRSHQLVEALLARGEGRFLDAARLWAGLSESNAMLHVERLGFLYFAAGDQRNAARTFRELERRGRELLRQGSTDVDDWIPLALAQSMLGEHAAALATIDGARASAPEAQDPVNGPAVSFFRSVVLTRAGRTAEGYAELDRLARVPFGIPLEFPDLPPVFLLLAADPRYAAVINAPPRL